MTTTDFNKKYEQYLEEGHYGLDFNNEEFINWLDIKFQEFIKIEVFSYSQIKEKYYGGRFYCKGLTSEQIKEVEDKITEIMIEKRKKFEHSIPLIQPRIPSPLFEMITDGNRNITYKTKGQIYNDEDTK